MNRHAGGGTRGGSSCGGGGSCSCSSSRRGSACHRGGGLGGRSAWASGDGVDERFARLVGTRAVRFFGVSANDAVVVVREVVAGVFPVDGWREGLDVDGLPYASGMVIWLSGQNAKVCHAEMVVLVGGVLHDCRFEGSGCLPACGEVLLATLGWCSFRFANILRCTWNAVGARAADGIYDARCLEFVELILRVY